MRNHKSPEDVVTTIETITPAMAALWLKESAHHNRPLKPAYVKAYARDMTEGRWVVNGQPIIFGPGQELLDGQHRLHAIVEAGVPVMSAVTTNVPLAHFPTLDRGKPRSFADVLAINGYKSTHRLAAVTQVYAQIVLDDAQQFDSRMQMRTMDELQAFFLEHEAAVQYGARKAQQTRQLMAGGIIGSLMILAREQSPAEAEEFVVSLAIGANLTPDDPVLHMRNLLYVRTLGKDRTRRSRTEQYYLGAVAWNLRRQGRSGRTLRKQWTTALGQGRRPVLV